MDDNNIDRLTEAIEEAADRILEGLLHISLSVDDAFVLLASYYEEDADNSNNAGE